MRDSIIMIMFGLLAAWLGLALLAYGLHGRAWRIEAAEALLLSTRDLAVHFTAVFMALAWPVLTYKWSWRKWRAIRAARIR